MKIRLHDAERFINWYPHHTKLYLRGERGADASKAFALQKELFAALVPFLDDVSAQARAEALEEAARLVDRALTKWRDGEAVTFQEIALNLRDLASKGGEP